MSESDSEPVPVPVPGTEPVPVPVSVPGTEPGPVAEAAAEAPAEPGPDAEVVPVPTAEAEPVPDVDVAPVPVEGAGAEPAAPAGAPSEAVTKVSVSDVRTAVAASPGMEAGMVTLREDFPPHRVVPIVIGQPEARAIQAAWSGVIQRRPSTWDLFMSTVAMFDARLDRAVITAVEEGRHFFAHIEFERAGERRVLAARPSDAIALALRAFGAEIYVAEKVMIDLGLGEPPIDN